MKIGDKVKLKKDKNMIGVFHDKEYIITEVFPIFNDNTYYIAVDRIPGYKVLADYFFIDFKDTRNKKLKEIDENR